MKELTVNRLLLSAQFLLLSIAAVLFVPTLYRVLRRGREVPVWLPLISLIPATPPVIALIHFRHPGPSELRTFTI